MILIFEKITLWKNGDFYGFFSFSPNSTDCTKTIEGTLSGILAQAIVLPFLIHFGFVRYSLYVAVQYGVAILASSLVETFTDQVDNLILPLVTYILLSI